ADLAGIHLLDEETGEYNYPYVKHMLQDIAVVIIHLADRIQGLMVARGNPRNIQGLEDLARPDVVFVNRQKG
ncbi:MAG: substrate-binding domain-containing protein, partial [Dehalococcoidales bacterium]|nr:substrate-binding domain-containing protein [Dehalococcoidales bacterium]